MSDMRYIEDPDKWEEEWAKFLKEDRRLLVFGFSLIGLAFFGAPLLGVFLRWLGS